MNMSITSYKNEFKIIIKTVLFICALLMFMECCRVEKLTHLSEKELEWIPDYMVGQKLIFLSNKGHIDTMTITDLNVHNSLFLFKNPFLKFEVTADRIAYKGTSYNITHDGKKIIGCFSIHKNN